MKEPNMSDTDQQVRTLFAAAADDIPPGIDLVSGFRARRAARHVRVRVTLAAAAACVVAAASIITLTIVQAPSALAELTSAISRTAGQTYHFGATITTAPLRPDEVLPAPRVRVTSGAFNPPQRVGEETSSSGQLRFIGGYVYLAAGKDGKLTLPDGKSWARVASPQMWAPVTADQRLTINAGILSVAETSPQNLFAMLKSVSTVDRQGSASGTGWTGTRYAFSVGVTFDLGQGTLVAVTATGTVDVDQQGRVRHLDAAYTLPAVASAPAERDTVDMTFSDFGAAVSVSPPPASEVFIPGT
jgi:hypothetical protein